MGNNGNFFRVKYEKFLKLLANLFQKTTSISHLLNIQQNMCYQLSHIADYYFHYMTYKLNLIQHHVDIIHQPLFHYNNSVYQSRLKYVCMSLDVCRMQKKKQIIVRDCSQIIWSTFWPELPPSLPWTSTIIKSTIPLCYTKTALVWYFCVIILVQPPSPLPWTCMIILS